MGLKGNINQKEYLIGNSKLLEKYNILNNYKKDEESLSILGNSIIYVVENNVILAIIGVNDIVRDEAKELVKKLDNLNINQIILTGDNDFYANNIAKLLNIKNVISNVLPKEKVNEIKKLKDEGKFVLMCGDGINDSPSLVSSNIGLTINEATDIAIDSADVILSSNNLLSIIKLINISKQTIKIIKENLFWAFFYNILMIPIAMGIFGFLGISITPMIASLAMVLSSLTVALNTLRLKIILK